ncbi:HNH endonuclease [Methylosinus sp. RM1]|uniref:HNH endonuclease n=1 Tax=Methylosinus sp. RM1 TaxID=2583817 RepID=UPI00351AAD3D
MSIGPVFCNHGSPRLDRSKIVRRSIPFDARGFPIFDNVAVVDLTVPDRAAFFAVGPQEQMAMATKTLRGMINSDPVYKARLGFSLFQLRDIEIGVHKIKGYAWHHHQQPGRMQLVPENLHKVSHVGGSSMNRCMQTNRKDG